MKKAPTTLFLPTIDSLKTDWNVKADDILFVSTATAQDVQVETKSEVPDNGQYFMVDTGDGNFIRKWVPYSEGHFETVDVGGGGTTRIWVASDPIIRATQLKAQREATLKNMKRSGLADIMDFMSANFADSMMDLKLMDYQEKSLSKTLGEYRRKFDSVKDDSDKAALLKIAYGKKVYEILLPEQLKSIAAKTDRKRRLFSVLVYSSERNALKITDLQNNKIVAECEILNAEIAKTIEKIEDLENKCREKMLLAYERVLTPEQKNKFAESLNVKEFLDKMKLQDMESDTDLKQFKN